MSNARGRAIFCDTADKTKGDFFGDTYSSQFEGLAKLAEDWLKQKDGENYAIYALETCYDIAMKEGSKQRPKAKLHNLLAWEFMKRNDLAYQYCQNEVVWDEAKTSGRNFE